MRIILLLVLPVFMFVGCSKEKTGSAVVSQVVRPLVMPGNSGVTQNPDVFNYYVDRLEENGFKMPCRARAGEGVEPCMTDTFESVVKQFEFYRKRCVVKDE